ncbi:MAG: ABC transporter ATP-binding protein [Thermoplasmata archaeon]|nr:ABC transporter ATP-binding protein [Thermoplasmata archaeon]
MTPAPPAALTATNVTVRYRAVPALTHVSLEARAGEFVALAGPNGSGKTSFIRAALGLVVPTEGTIAIGGVPVPELSLAARARALAWMPQEEPAGDNVSIRDYVGYGRYAHSQRFVPEGVRDREIAEQILRDFGFAGRESVGVQELSGGERQRLRLARVLAQDSPVLLLDEPTAHLDMGYQLDLLERVHGIARSQGRTVIAALHDLNLAARFADRIVVLQRGRKVADGAPAAVLSPALLRDVWGVVADLRRDERSGLPYLIPRLPVLEVVPPDRSRGLRVHVVGGGGSAAPILHALVAEGHRVSLGAVALFDTDSETAGELGIPTATELPFVPLGDEVRARNRELLQEADAVVVAPFQVGPGNVAVLDDILQVAVGKRLYLVDTGVAGRDHTGGVGTERLRALAARSVRVLDSADLLRALASASGSPAAQSDDADRGRVRPLERLEKPR